MDKSSIKKNLLDRLSKSTPPEGSIRLKPNLDRVLEDLRSFLRKTSQEYTIRSEAAHWICDNSYLVEQCANDLLRSSRSLSFSLCVDCLELLDTTDGNLNKEAVESLYEVKSKEALLTDREIRQIPGALIFSVLLLIGELCLKGEGPAKELFTSLRFCMDFDHTGYINGFSPLERLLRCDPTGVYPRMDKSSQEEYRRALIRYAKRNKMAPTKAYEKLLHSGEEKAHLFPQQKGKSFLLCFSLLFLLLQAGTSFFFYDAVDSILWLICTILLIPINLQLSTLVIRFLASVFLSPRPLLRLKIDSCPDDARTCVAYTELFSTVRSVDNAFEKTELLFLSQFPKMKRDPNVFFGVIADLKPSKQKNDPSDPIILNQIQLCCDRLNLKYGGGFFCYLREREYAESENVYCGKERKRGAILEFSEDVIGECTTKRWIGDRQFKGRIRYLVTLDSDTTMGFRRIYPLIGAMLHPFNRPVIQTVNGAPLVTEGHGIMQPSVGFSLRSFHSSPFSVMQAGAGGREPYQSGGFDSYQDVFGVGMFCGKGVIDLPAYQAVCSGAFPEGVVLSHDILEGSRLNCGYLRDECFADTTPSDTLTYEKRRHRWVRGDTQSLMFALPKILDPRKQAKIKNPIRLPFRLAIWENFINDLSPVLSFLLITLTFFMNGRMAWRVALVTLLPTFLPLVLSLVSALVSGEWGRVSRKFSSNVIGTVWSQLLRFLKGCLSLASDAFASADAILRAFYRLVVSKKKLLEWTTYSSDKASASFLRHLKENLPSLLVGTVLFTFSSDRPSRLFGLLWMVYPFVSYQISQTEKSRPKLTEKETGELIGYLKDSFAFFEQNVNKKGNFLPPDNLSVSPCESVAMRCSPTNIGLYLLSLLGARDFSLITTPVMVRRLKETFSSIEQMEKHKGNLYNWYDTQTLLPLGKKYVSTVDSGNLAVCLIALRQGLEEYRYEDDRVGPLLGRIDRILLEMRFEFLFDHQKNLFYIGYDCEENRPDSNHYDMYMSEARLTSYYCVAKGVVPPSHWYRLGRPLGESRRHIGALSWTGTCFEYFMPSLLFPVFKNSFESESLSFAYREQRAFSFKEKNLFGVSESGYFAFDSDMNYQYRAFGVESLRMKREADSTLVISPYSSFLMLKADPSAILSNLRRMKRCGMYGKYGFYEALDCNLNRTGGHALVKSYMTHHIGMSILAIANLLQKDRFVKRFCRDQSMKAACVLLEERIPVDAVILKRKAPVLPPRLSSHTEAIKRSVQGAEKHFLYPGRNCGLIISSQGRNQFVFKKGADDVLAFRPYGHESFGGIRVQVFLGNRCYSSVKSENPEEAVFRFYDCGCYCDFTIRKEKEFVRIRFVPLYGESTSFSISISVTGYCGLAKAQISMSPVLCQREKYNAHPCFSDLFLQLNEMENDALMLLRRPREAKNDEIVAVMGFYSDERDENYYQCGEPSDFSRKRIFSKTGEGLPLLYPALSFTQRKMIKGTSLNNDFLYCLSFGYDREKTLLSFRSALQRLSTPKGLNKELASPRLGASSALNSKEGDAILKQWIYRDFDRFVAGGPQFRREELWSYGICGDLPVVTLSVSDETVYKLERQILQKKTQFLTGVQYDLAILVACDGYRREDFDRLMALLHKNGCGFMIGKKGGIHPIAQTEDSLSFFQRISDLFLDVEAPKKRYPSRTFIKLLPAEGHNGGEFIHNGFLIHRKSVSSPPWTHILCSKTAGTALNDKSLGYTWWSNSALKRITYWNNDPFSDPKGETVFLCLGENVPIDLVASSGSVSYLPGLAKYKGEVQGVSYTVTVGIHPQLSYKYVRVDLTKEGDLRNATIGMRICPVMGEKNEYIGKMSLSACREGVEFYRTLSDSSFPQKGILYTRSPQIQKQPLLYSHSDGCLSVALEGELSKENPLQIHFLLGVYATDKQKKLITESLNTDPSSLSSSFACELLTKRNLCGSEDGNRIFPFWLAYQTVFSRILGKTGFYQSGGAFGFRDQLQDSLALMKYQPKAARLLLLRCACHQFPEGDVLHWWHNEGSGAHKGIRTRCSDDYLWLVWALCDYLEETKDHSVLEVPLPYLIGAPLKEHEQERYSDYRFTQSREPLFNHAIAAIRLLLAKGTGGHGFPKMGNGDWNDGMNEVGKNGGESVWLGMFSVIAIKRFLSLASLPTKIKRSSEEYCRAVLQAIDSSFNGSWYPRAWFASGVSLGNDITLNSECSIDLLPQAFSVFLYHYVPEFRCDLRRSRMIRACDNAYRLLFDEEHRILKLFTPAFHSHEPDPGYIQGYVAGVRENGGQYTHAAVWYCWALYYLTLYSPSNKEEYRIKLQRVLSCLCPSGLLNHPKHLNDYKNEPYVLSGDVYNAKNKQGRGGWSWYTGAAGWLYRLFDEMEKNKPGF